MFKKILKLFTSSEFFILSDRLSGIATGFLTLVIVLYYFDVSDSAKYFTFSAILGLLTQTSLFGLKQIFLREFERNTKSLSEFHNELLALLSIVTFISVSIFSFLSYIFFELTHFDIFGIIILAVFLPINIFEMSLYASKGYKQLASIKLATLIVFGILKIYMGYNTNLQILFIIIICEIAVKNILFFFVYKGLSGVQLTFRYRISRLSFYYKKSIPSFVNMILNIGTLRIVLLLISVIGDAEDVVMIGVSTRIMEMLNLLLNSFLMPKIVEFFAGNTSKHVDSSARSLSIFSTLVIIFSFLIFYIIHFQFDYMHMDYLVCIFGASIYSVVHFLQYVSNQKLIKIEKIFIINIGAIFTFLIHVIFILFLINFGRIEYLFFMALLGPFIRDFFLVDNFLDHPSQKYVKSHYKSFKITR